MGTFVNSSFTIDSIPEQMFEGYSDGDTWNGWACPYFERMVAEKVLRASEANGYRWTIRSRCVPPLCADHSTLLSPTCVCRLVVSHLFHTCTDRHPVPVSVMHLPHALLFAQRPSIRPPVCR